MMGRLNHDQEQFFYSFEPDDRPAPLHQDAGALYGGFLGGPLVSMVGIGLHHKICHALGGHFNLRHGETNSVILPHVVAFNAPALPAVIGDIARAIGTSDVVAAIFALAERIGAPTSLRELGLVYSGLDPVAEEIAIKATGNPRPINADDIRALLSASAAPRPQAPHLLHTLIMVFALYL